MALVVLIDGEPLPPDAAQAFWTRFSAHMEENKGDLAGFAAKEGLASVQPELRDGRPALIGRKTGAQAPYGNAPNRESRPAQRTAAPHESRKKRGR